MNFILADRIIVGLDFPVRTPNLRRERVLAASFAILAGAVGPVWPVRGETRTCEDAAVAVTADNSAEIGQACAAAAAALAFLRDNGLETGWPVDLHLVPALPPGTPARAAGCYVGASDRVYVLTYAACLQWPRTRTVLGEPLAPDIYRSLVAHEVAHDIARHNFRTASPPWAAQEYIAYVTQMATLPETTRARILARLPAERIGHPAELNSVLLMTSADAFAAQAWRHYLLPGNGAAFMQSLVAGEAVPNYGLSPP